MNRPPYSVFPQTAPNELHCSQVQNIQAHKEESTIWPEDEDTSIQIYIRNGKRQTENQLRPPIEALMMSYYLFDSFIRI